VAKTYRINELFWSIQGEGANTGTASVFVRFSGCNQWSGRDMDRVRGLADCARWCDTDFYSGAPVEHAELLSRIDAYRDQARLVVFTGGEPGLQLTDELLRDVVDRQWQCAIETNGTVVLPRGDYWLTVSPKGGKHPLVVRGGDELKLVYPQLGVQPAEVEQLKFSHWFLQPRDNTPDHTRACLDYIRQHPQWRLSVQTHKYIGVR
jgi:7-carboxy-7-deazaguanine synthase